MLCNTLDNDFFPKKNREGNQIEESNINIILNFKSILQTNIQIYTHKKKSNGVALLLKLLSLSPLEANSDMR